ncbi:MAG: CooT family nickel-binding protein [Thermoleophilia bacterium]|nr:CooT family nickel-binding protein [Thermoleophilia bacterium]
MCELNVYMLGEVEEKLVMEDVANIVPEGDAVVLTDILGQQKVVDARILEIRLLDHKVFLGR